MTLLQAFRAYGWVSAVIVVLTVAVAVVLERGGERTFTASGNIMIARPEIDPSRVASRSVDLTNAITDTSTAEARTAFAEDGGRDDFRIIQVDENRAQVLASGDGAVPAVRAVLRSLSDNVAEQQRAAEVEPEERIRPRLFLQIPEDDIEALGALEGSVSGELPEVVGTLMLEDPLAGIENPLGGVAAATRLVLLRINSDDGTRAMLDSLPPNSNFSITSADGRARELLTVTTTAANPPDALESFDLVTAAVEAELDRRQELAEVPSDARLLVDVIAAPAAAIEVEEGLGGRTLALLLLGFGSAVAAPRVLPELGREGSRGQQPPGTAAAGRPEMRDADRAPPEHVGDEAPSIQGARKHPVP